MHAIDLVIDGICILMGVAVLLGDRNKNQRVRILSKVGSSLLILGGLIDLTNDFFHLPYRAVWALSHCASSLYGLAIGIFFSIKTLRGWKTKDEPLFGFRKRISDGETRGF
jgi:hypothetical protein